MLTDTDFVRSVYERFDAYVAIARKRLGRPLTLAEKILFAHLDQPETQEIERGESYAFFRPDRVAMQDATAQMALLQFMLVGRSRRSPCPPPSTATTSSRARDGAGGQRPARRHVDIRLRRSTSSSRRSSAKYGIGFWKPGAGIIHQVILENYAFPGAMMVGTDSHTPNAGGLGMVAIGVGGADAVDVMADFRPWEPQVPEA